MKILVTGSAGFIGFHLTEALLKKGDEVTGIDSINDYYDVGLKYRTMRLSFIGQMKCYLRDKYSPDATEPV